MEVVLRKDGAVTRVDALGKLKFEDWDGNPESLGLAALLPPVSSIPAPLGNGAGNNKECPVVID